MTNTANAAKPATAPQVNYLRDLLASREVPADAAQRLLAAIDNETLNRADASQAITWLQRQAKAYAPSLFVVATPSDAVVAAAEQVVEAAIAEQAPAKPEPVTEEGMYENDHGVFRVLAGKKGLYAKKLSGRKYFYAPGVIFKLTAADRMTVERAEELSEAIGHCCRCGRKLVVEDSVKAGIGPKCRKKI